MNMKEFSRRILREVEEKVGKAFTVELTENRKNNGAMRTAVSAAEPGGKGGICIYLEGYYEGYKAGEADAGSMAEDIYQKIISHCHDLKHINLDSLRDWKQVEPRIRAKLVNREMNRQALGDMPHRKFLDLAVIYYVEVSGLPGDGTGSILVQDRYMGIWRQDEASLFQAACANMRLAGAAVFEDMAQVLRGMMPEPLPFSEDGDTAVKMYVLTNKEKVFGAAELLDSGTLKEIGCRLGGDYVVLPSSVHECIIIPAEVAASYQELSDIVEGINRDAVIKEERLSDHIYLYEREEGVLRIAA